MMMKITGKIRQNDHCGSRLEFALINSLWLRFARDKEVKTLVDLALLLRGHSGIKFDFAKSAFILAYVLLQYGQQRLGLLRAEIKFPGNSVPRLPAP